MPKRIDIQSILIIGQACEFDYSIKQMMKEFHCHFDKLTEIQA